MAYLNIPEEGGGGGGPATAGDLPFVPNGDIAATDTQAAIQEVRDDTDTKLAGKADSVHDHDHDALTNFVANEHVNHTTVSISAGTGLSGGGDISANRTLNLANTAVTPATYGSSSSYPSFTVDAQGRLTNSENKNLPFVIVDPSEGSVGIVNAINSVNSAGGGIVQLLEGTYSVTARMTPTTPCNNVVVQGVGNATILDVQALTGLGDSFFSFEASAGSVRNINATTKGALTFTCTTAAQASDFTTSRIALLEGTDVRGNEVFEICEIISADAGTGIVTVKHPLKHAISTSGTAFYQIISARDILLSSFRVIDGSGTAVSLRGIELSGCINSKIEDVVYDGINSATSTSSADAGFFIQNSTNIKLDGCKVRDLTTGSGIGILRSDLVHLDTLNIFDVGGYFIKGEILGGQIIVKNSDFNGSNSVFSGIAFNTPASGNIHIHNNRVFNSAADCIELGDGVNAIISNNFVAKTNTGGHYCISVSGALSRNCTITGNVVQGAENGIGVSTAGHTGSILADNIARDCTIGFVLNPGVISCDVSGNVAQNCSFAYYLSGDAHSVDGNVSKSCTNGLYGVTLTDSVLSNNNIDSSTTAIRFDANSNNNQSIHNERNGNTYTDLGANNVMIEVTGAYGQTISSSINLGRQSISSTGSSQNKGLIGVNSSGGAVTLTLENDYKEDGRIIIVKDVNGSAATNNITVQAESGNIDGAASVIITANYGVVRLFSDGTNWFSF